MFEVVVTILAMITVPFYLVVIFIAHLAYRRLMNKFQRIEKEKHDHWQDEHNAKLKQVKADNGFDSDVYLFASKEEFKAYPPEKMKLVALLRTYFSYTIAYLILVGFCSAVIIAIDS